jgi:hypothetical protein
MLVIGLMSGITYLAPIEQALPSTPGQEMC